MSFRTDFALKTEPFLDHKRPILTLGSCFAEHIGQKLVDARWPGCNAPFGTLFHPLALARLLELVQSGSELDPALLLEHDGAFFHHDLHSRFHAASPEALQLRWRRLAADVRAVLEQNPCILLTLGTAWVYETGAGRVVANCHKQPAQVFHKRLLRQDEIRSSLELMRKFVPKADWIVSLSPVRHMRDTMILNQLSKSLLLIELHAFCERHADHVRYFPAYEIMLDDLRDYRFYDRDRIHPSAEAVDYIWEKFLDCYAKDAVRKFLQIWEPIQQTLRHRPQRPEAPSYQRHLQNMLQMLKSLPDEYPEETLALEQQMSLSDR